MLGNLQRVQVDAKLPRSPVTLVWIDEHDIQRHGYPLSDGVIAQALDMLLAHNPRAVGFDLYRDTPVPPGSDLLKTGLTAHPNVIVVHKLPDESGHSVPGPSYLPANRLGFSDMPVDPDGAVRRALMMMWDDTGAAHFGFSTQLALLYLYRDNITLTAADDNPANVKLGIAEVPPIESYFGGYGDIDAGGYQFFLDGARSPGEIPALRFADVYDGTVVDASLLTDRAIIVATASPSVKDLFTDARSHTLYGGEVHAMALDGLWRIATGVSQPITTLSSAMAFVWLLLCCGAGATAGTRVRHPVEMTTLMLILPVAIFGVAAITYAQAVWVAAATPMLGCVVNFGIAVAIRLRKERVEKDAVMQLFGRFISKRIAAQIWAERDNFMDGRRPQTGARSGDRAVQRLEWLHHDQQPHGASGGDGLDRPLHGDDGQPRGAARWRGERFHR